MSISNQFIKSVLFDDVKRIIITVQEAYQSYLQVERLRQMLKKAAVDTLGENFEKLEISRSSCRITVKAGTEEESMHKIKEELIKGLEMAMNFMK